jgi:hypothetical protein
MEAFKSLFRWLTNQQTNQPANQLGSCSRVLFWEAGTSSDSQEISRILQNEKCSLPCLKHPASSSHPESHEFLFKISFNIVLPSTPRSSKWFFFRFPDQSPGCTSFPIRATCPAQLDLDLIIGIACGEEYRSWSSLHLLFQEACS